ncbi:Uncharacterised protein [Mycobacteroides abscessus subsp. abscessus]|nr:Uncharacterised protein [Mycobacteroides abscessus subsp. abscessus]
MIGSSIAMSVAVVHSLLLMPVALSSARIVYSRSAWYAVFTDAQNSSPYPGTFTWSA